MKKIALLLAVVVLLSCCMLAACTGSDETSSAASSEATAESSEAAVESSEAAAESSEAAVESSEAETPSEVEDESSEETPSEPETSDDTPAAGGVKQEVNRDGDNLALNCTVTGADVPGREGIQNYSAKLTDGQVEEAVVYTNAWFAYWKNNDPQWDSQSNTKDGVGIATVDLGSAKEIKSICTHIAEGCNAGIITPSLITFEYSVDGSSYTKVGEIAFETPADPTDLTSAWHGFTFDAVSARYVRVSYTAAGVWTFLNEIEVH